jgi:hypothetical protein
MEVLEEERAVFTHALGFVGMGHGDLGKMLALISGTKEN